MRHSSSLSWWSGVRVGSGGGNPSGSTTARRAPARYESRASELARSDEGDQRARGRRSFTSAPRFSEADQSDQAFIVNARRAITEYRSFIEKAGEDSEYAEAVKRSRERIADLEQTIIWVEQGRNARAPGELPATGSSSPRVRSARGRGGPRAARGFEIAKSGMTRCPMTPRQPRNRASRGAARRAAFARRRPKAPAHQAMERSRDGALSSGRAS